MAIKWHITLRKRFYKMIEVCANAIVYDGVKAVVVVINMY